MRISDWSSDVCSSDLIDAFHFVEHLAGLHFGDPVLDVALAGAHAAFERLLGDRHLRAPRLDRTSVVSGKSVSVRVDLGGRRIIKKKNTQKSPAPYPTTHQTHQPPHSQSPTTPQ